METNYALSVENISFAVDNKKIIDDISLNVPKGSFVGIIGPNGSGKSTLLKTIYRVNKASNGAVYIDGKNMDKMSSKEIAREMAVVAQEHEISFDFSVLEVMMIGLYANRSFLDKAGTNDTEICEKALAEVGMLDKKNRSFQSLSGGEKQKVQIASAFSRNSNLIVLDEPTNHLDIGYQFLVLDIMKARKDVTIFTTIHDLNMAMQYCDYIIALKDGKIVTQGVPQDVITEDMLHDLFHVKAKFVKGEGDKPYIQYLGCAE